MDLFNSFKNLKVYDNTLFHLEDVYESYLKYIELLEKLPPKHLATFVELIKERELINNQELERENTFLYGLRLKEQKITSIDEVAIMFNNKAALNSCDLEKLHKLVIKNTDDDREENYHYRNKETKVGKVVDGKDIISYIPPTPNDIMPSIKIILDFLNDNNKTRIIDNIFLKPIIAHALIAILQPFNNGNTRFARLLQYGKIMDLTNKNMNKQFKKPILYLSENYLMTKGYRTKIGELAIDQTDDSWNKWFNYNLNAIEEQLFFSSNNLELYIKKNNH